MYVCRRGVGWAGLDRVLTFPPTPPPLHRFDSTPTCRQKRWVQRRQLQEDIIPQLASEPEQAAKLLLEELPKIAQRTVDSLPKNPKDVSACVRACLSVCMRSCICVCWGMLRTPGGRDTNYIIYRQPSPDETTPTPLTTQSPILLAGGDGAGDRDGTPLGGAQRLPPHARGPGDAPLPPAPRGRRGACLRWRVGDGGTDEAIDWSHIH